MSNFSGSGTLDTGLNQGDPLPPPPPSGSSAWGGITGTLSDQTDLQSALDAKVDEVVGKQLSTEDYTTVEKNKLAGIASGATANSTDAQLRDRSTHTGTQAATTITEDSTHRFTTDSEKTTWNNKQDALGYTPENTSNRNAVNGYAGLDASGLIPSALLPSYVDDVLEYADLASFPGTGTTGKMYIAIDTGKTYRWSGSVYVEISASPGSSDSVTEGSVNLYFTTTRVLSTLLAGLSAASGTFTSSDSILTAFGKIKYLIDNFTSLVQSAAPAETASTVGALINGASSATPNDTDLVATAESSVLKKITWANVKAYLQAYFDSLYQATSATLTDLSSRWTKNTATDASRLDFLEGSNNGTNKNSLKGNDSLSSDITSTLPLRSGTLEVAIDRETMGDADKTYSAGKTQVALTATLTAARVLTLPAASAFPAGTALEFVDEVGSITATNTVTVTRAGSDTVNGANTLVIKAGYSVGRFITDGSSKWTAEVTIPYSSGTYTPTVTGFSTPPTGIQGNWEYVGGWLYVEIDTTGNGVSNATTKTFTLPPGFVAASDIAQVFISQVTDNNVNAIGRVITRTGSGTVDVYPSMTSTTWTAASSNAQFKPKIKLRVG